MKRYRCPKCKTIFDKKHPNCPNCGQELHYLDELSAPHHVEKEEETKTQPIEVSHFDFEEAEKEQEQSSDSVSTKGNDKKVEEKLDYVVDKSYFDGNPFQKLGWVLLGTLISILTLGICVPWAICMVISWETKHTVIDGKRLEFDGKGGQLLGRYILWAFLTIITLGIFLIWANNSFMQWKAKHIHFQEEK